MMCSYIQNKVALFYKIFEKKNMKRGECEEEPVLYCISRQENHLSFSPRT